MDATLVVKCGGSPSIDQAALVADAAELVAQGCRLVLVHGGAQAVDELAEELRRPLRSVVSESGVRGRYTDEAALDTLTLALAGRVKPALVRRLVDAGVPAVGLTGLDAGLVYAEAKSSLKVVEGGRPAVLRGNRSGRVVRVEPRLLTLLLDAGYVPVLSPPVHGGDSGPLNVDSDRLAAAVAAAVGADSLVLLTDVPGVLEAVGDETSVVRCAGPEALLRTAQGRMRVKVVAACEAIAGGVRTVVIADGRRGRPIAAALAGEGTRVEAEPAEVGG